MSEEDWKNIINHFIQTGIYETLYTTNIQNNFFNSLNCFVQRACSQT